ncbi:hypothetical protein Tdes44962_MAKER05967 [Teratosphaeria destructans]|uniref:Apple domain-containing protein n=1 Tax=Teratosphaeria destructans TaxID=418781 RepID=A0A9W7SJ30_9PEZI|nr:hypothetical protein Tdes44962_MAKER05967 [Teratosphaeria destructans]
MGLIANVKALAMLGLAVGAAPTSPSVSTSVTRDQTCISKIRPANTGTGSVLTSTRTSSTIISKTVMISQSPATSTTVVTPAAITSTRIINATSAGAVGPNGALTTVFKTVTANNGSANDGACASTQYVSANGTTTVYTGTYSNAASKRTAAPLDLQESSAEKRDVSYALFTNHWFNQTWNLLAIDPFEIDCLEKATTYRIATETISAADVTSTITASTPVRYITSTQIVNATPASTLISTVTVSASYSAVNNAASICTVTTGQAAATTTQHIKCAPTNLITEVNGQGIGSVQGHANETQGIANGSDPSACCQLCVDTDGCAASEDDQGAGNCFLYYTSSPTCGLGFNYRNSSTLAAGEGFSVQTGCGYIEPVSS